MSVPILAEKFGILPHGRCYAENGNLFFDWSNAGFSYRFFGTAVVIVLQSIGGGSPPIWVQTELDGKVAAYPLSVGENRLTLSCEEGTHLLTVRRRSEIGLGRCALSGLQVNGKRLAPPAFPALHFEFVGDSLLCGHSNLCEQPPKRFDTRDEDGTQTFATMTAAAFGAECTVVAKSGVGLTVNYDGTRRFVMPLRYAQTAAWSGVEASAVLSDHPADLVVISLGTNDSVRGVSPSEFIPAAVDFLQMLHSKQPKARLVWCYGIVENRLADAIRIATEIAGFPVGCLLTAPRPEDAGFLHPRLRSHQYFARELQQFIREKGLIHEI